MRFFWGRDILSEKDPGCFVHSGAWRLWDSAGTQSDYILQMWFLTSYTGRFVEMEEFSGDSWERPRAKVSHQIGASASLGQAPSELCSRKSSMTWGVFQVIALCLQQEEPSAGAWKREQAQWVERLGRDLEQKVKGSVLTQWLSEWVTLIGGSRLLSLFLSEVGGMKQSEKTEGRGEYASKYNL